jgi:hypothetical protein
MLWLLKEMTAMSLEVEVTVKLQVFGLKVTCNLCVRKSRINIEREDAKPGQEQQAQKMVSLSNSRLPATDIGTNVVIRVPDLDRGRLAPRNVLAVVVDVNTSGLYLLGKKEGILERLYARNEFSQLLTTSRHMMCPQVHSIFGQPQ